jgi:hypothetical protein
MRSYDEILADIKPGPAFSNSDQFEYWADGPRGCYSCRNDSMGGGPDEPEKFCPILSAAVGGAGIPQEWTTVTDEDHIHGDYTCAEYDERPDDEGDDGPDPEPTPPPVIAGQIDMFEVFADRIVDEASVQPTEAGIR